MPTKDLLDLPQPPEKAQNIIRDAISVAFLPSMSLSFAQITTPPKTWVSKYRRTEIKKSSITLTSISD